MAEADAATSVPAVAGASLSRLKCVRWAAECGVKGDSSALPFPPPPAPSASLPLLRLRRCAPPDSPKADEEGEGDSSRRPPALLPLCMRGVESTPPRGEAPGCCPIRLSKRAAETMRKLAAKAAEAERGEPPAPPLDSDEVPGKRTPLPAAAALKEPLAGEYACAARGDSPA